MPSSGDSGSIVTPGAPGVEFATVAVDELTALPEVVPSVGVTRT